MTTARHQQLEIVRSEQPARGPANPRQALTEEACLTALTVLGTILLLVTLLLAAKLVYLALTMQNGMFVLPSAGAF